MHCTNCGNELLPQANFCTRCGSRVAVTTATPPAPAAQTAAAAAATLGSLFWQRLKQSVVLQLQQQAMANAMRQSGDNFWSSATARGNDNGSSGYVDVGGYIVGYDR